MPEPSPVIVLDGITVADLVRALRHSGLVVSNAVQPHLFVVRKAAPGCGFFGEGRGQCILEAGHGGAHKFACNCGYVARSRGWFPMLGHKPNCASNWLPPG